MLPAIHPRTTLIFLTAVTGFVMLMTPRQAEANEASVCHLLFAREGLVIRELARLRVTADLAHADGKQELSTIFYRLFDEKLRNARGLNLDLTSLADLIRVEHEQVRENSAVATARSERARALEKDAIAPWVQDKTLQGHATSVFAAEFGPDGSRLVTGSWDKSVIAWDLNGNQLSSAKANTDSVLSVAINHDGSRFATRSRNEVIFWDASGKQLHEIKRPSKDVVAIAQSLDRSRIAVGFSDGVTLVGDFNGNLLQPFQGPASKITALAFNNDGTRIAAGAQDAGGSTVTIWNANGRQPQQLKGHSSTIKSVAFEPSGSDIATASPNEVIIWDQNGNRLRQLYKSQNGRIQSVAYLPDGSRILIVDGEVAMLWDPNGGLISVLRHSHTILAAAISPTSQIATGATDGPVIIWDMHGNQLQSLTGHSSHINSIAFSPDGSHMVTGSSDKTAKIWRNMAPAFNDKLASPHR